MKTIYVAGPYTKVDPALNVRIAIDAAQILLQKGYYPFVPHLTHFWHMIHFVNYEKWMDYDFVWLSKCDALLRLPGESPGADREVEFATKNNITVYYDINDIK